MEKWIAAGIALSCGLPLTGQSYLLNKPDNLWHLPPVLLEVSGLTFSGQDEWLLAIQDESGAIYGLEPGTGTLMQTWPLAPPGDYEGIEWARDTLYLLHSSGRIHRIPWQNGPSGEEIVLPSPFPGKSDIEGLGWDPVRQVLLLACKDMPGQNPDDPKGWVSWHPAGGIPDTRVTGIDRITFREAISRTKMSRATRRRLFKWLDNKPGSFPLGPSGIAVHPHSGRVFLLSARGKLLLEFERDATLRHIHPLPARWLPQAEGIAFDTKGHLYIASEGKKGQPGRIAVYHPRP